ncbi:MAG: hypothetical protein GX665_03430 [Gammaproteobacteria bacterium]|nr:hypothetical protein [Gammaproteobacteria bacterium]
MSRQLDKPEPPGEYDCCESACEPCVWDLYYEDLAEWNRQQQALKSQAQNGDNGDEPAG